ncbi:MAG: prephenate dehydrogenase/arogenate dehydrogenase family protein [Acidimicrobiales bacterium]
MPPAAEAGSEPGRALVIRTGLIGGSVGLALRKRGWRVTGSDTDPARGTRALEVGAADDLLGPGAVPDPPRFDLTVVATPVDAVAPVARAALAFSRVVTDVAGVKASVVETVGDARFVGGHPMAGSEQLGLDGADPDLFEGATWVLTPTAETDPAAFTRVREMATSLGAHVVAVSPSDHDALVAVVSHVPHLTAAALMTLASAGAEEHASMLRLAAGGFRDMTRIAAGHPGIWPDICAANRDAILASLDGLIDKLDSVRGLVDRGDRSGLLELLEKAHVARRNLPARLTRPEDLVEIRVPIPDRPGTLAEITTLAAELGVNIYDFGIAHSVEGDQGTLLIVVDAGLGDLMRGALLGRGFRPSAQPL